MKQSRIILYPLLVFILAIMACNSDGGVDPNSDPENPGQENPGTDSSVVDTSGNNNNGTLQGGATIETGHDGGGLRVVSNTSRAVVPDSPSLDISNQITLSAWIAPGRRDTQTVLTKARHDSIDGYELTLSSEGKVFVRFNQDTNFDRLRLNSTTAYPTTGTTWMHVVATYDGATIRLYVNGQLNASKAARLTIATNSTPLSIGAEANGSRAMRGGTIDDVLIANRAFSAAEVLSLYQNGTGFAPAQQAGRQVAGTRATLAASAAESDTSATAAPVTVTTTSAATTTVSTTGAKSPSAAVNQQVGKATAAESKPITKTKVSPTTAKATDAVFARITSLMRR